MTDLAFTNKQALGHIGVIVPVHNEQKLLPGCLRSIARAAASTAVPVAVVVALDRCTDASHQVVLQAAATGLAVTAVIVDSPGVGAARAAGAAALIARHGRQRLWLATTDADSTVPHDWFARQLAHRDLGADVVVGTVAVQDWSEHPAAVMRRYLANYRPEPGHRHLHGANLSFAASSYLAAGGFQDVASDEDVQLVQRMEALGSVIAWAADLPVITSARRIGRAPLGFAGHLLTLAGSADVLS